MAEMPLEEPTRKWTGPALIKDLEQFLRDNHWIAVSEMFLPGWDARVDVMAIKPHAFATQDLRVYEVKVSRQDYHADERANKWRKYLDVAHRVFFACPAGLLHKEEIPKEAGLVVRGPNGWSVLKAPKGHHPPALTIEVVMAMLFKVHNTDTEIRRMKERVNLSENVELADAVRNMQGRIKEKLRDRMGWDTQRRVNAAEEFLAFCAKTLGLTREEQEYEIERILKAAQNLFRYGKLYEQVGEFISRLAQGYDVTTKPKELRDLIDRFAEMEAAPHAT